MNARAAVSIAGLNNDVYVLAEDAMYRFSGPDREPAGVIGAQGITHLASSADMLLAFSASGDIYTVAEQSLILNGRLAVLNGDDIAAAETHLRAVTISGGYIFAAVDIAADNGRETKMFRMDLDGRNAITLDIPFLQSACAYRPGELLLFQSDLDDYSVSPALIAYEIASGSTRKVFEFSAPAGGIAYCAQEDRVIFSSAGEMFSAREGQRPESLGNAESHWVGVERDVFQAICLPDRRYISISPTGKLSDIAWDKLDKPRHVLKIAGGIKDQAYRAFYKDNPDVFVNVDLPEATAEEMQRLILTGIDAPDLFLLDLYDGYAGLRSKKYLGSLNGSSALMESVRQFYPQIQGALFDGADLVAYPRIFSLNPWTLNETLWRAIYGERQYPSTYSDLFDLLEEWPEKYAEDYPEVTPIEFGGDTRMLVLAITRSYALQQYQAGIPIVFNTPAYADIINRALALERPGMDTVAEEDAYIAQKKLITFMPLQTFGIFYDEEQRIIPLAPAVFDKSADPAVPVRFQVYVLNPRSANIDIALSYLEAVMRSFPPETKAGMIQGWNETALSENATQTIGELDHAIARKQEELLYAKEQDRRMLQEAIEELYKQRAYQYQYGYAVSAESLALYRTLAPHMVIPVDSPFWGENSTAMREIDKILERMLDKQISLAQCVAEMDKKAAMVFLENAN
ncbi:MAG: hypothetical protein LBU67_05205 [Oscillospiraceae bacterium]|nr:hypothetical protein [Oscillospiraceae bacterium]